MLSSLPAGTRFPSRHGRWVGALLLGCAMAVFGPIVNPSAGPTVGVGLAHAADDKPTYGPWEWVRSDNGVAVHRRTVSTSPLHEFRGTGIIPAPIAALLAVMDDTDHRLEWMKEAAAQILVQQVDPQTVIFYNRTKAPWPVWDRDAVLRARTTFDTAEKMVRIDIEAVEHPAWPPQKGVVRMPFLRGHWHLRPEKNGQWTKAEYQVFANPGGSLPVWVINSVSKNIPHTTIVQLREQVKRRRYEAFERKISAVPDYQAIVQSGSTAPAPSPASAPGPSPAAPAAAPSPPLASPTAEPSPPATPPKTP